MDKFTKEKDMLLIELVKSHPILYDSTHKQYMNISEKYKVWKYISETLDISVGDCKKHWKHFRDHFRKKVKIESSTGSYGHTWEYMKLLTFLIPTFSQKRSIGIGPASMSSDNEEPIQEEAEEEMEPDRMPNFARHIEARARRRRFALEIAHHRKRRLVRPKEDPLKKFFEAMGEVVSKFPPHLAAETRLRVCQVVTEIELRMHSSREVTQPMQHSEDSDPLVTMKTEPVDME